MDFKTFTQEDVDELWIDLDEFKTEPYFHQKVSAMFCFNKKSAGVFSDIGTGKTLVALYTAVLNDANRVFIVCPNSVKYNWKREVLKHTTKTARVLEGTAEEKRRQIKEGEWAVITNFESLRWIFTGGKRERPGRGRLPGT